MFRQVVGHVKAFLHRRRDLAELIAVDPATGITADHLAAVETAFSR
ncbi:hypothetical protein [Saccharothrix sp. ALI-22-I]|nr:hypothetical protein [Saccharothrix sp. ALI-22-I]